MRKNKWVSFLLPSIFVLVILFLIVQVAREPGIFSSTKSGEGTEDQPVSEPSATVTITDPSDRTAQTEAETPSPPNTEVPVPTSTPELPPEDTFFVSSRGNDNDPGTEQQPWKTIGKAVQSLSSGETAIILAGDYPERIFISRNGITLQAEGQVTTRGFHITGNKNVIIGFTISDKNSEAGLYVQGDNNILAKNEIFHMKQDGIWFFGSGNIFRGNYVHDILDPSRGGDPHADCFQTWGPASNTLFENNVCNHNRTWGSNQILMLEGLKGQVKNLTFRNNVFMMHDPGYSPMNFHRKPGQKKVSNMIIVNNTIAHMNGIGQYAIRLKSISGATVQNNLIINYGTSSKPYVYIEGSSDDIQISNNAIFKTDGVPPRGGPYPNDVWMEDPGIASFAANDFHLTNGSLLIDAGVSLPEVAWDYDWEKRPVGGGHDIGAFEYSGD